MWPLWPGHRTPSGEVGLDFTSCGGAIDRRHALKTMLMALVPARAGAASVSTVIGTGSLAIRCTGEQPVRLVMAVTARCGYAIRQSAIRRLICDAP